MVGSITITAPHNMALRKLQVFINGEEWVSLSNNESATIELGKNSVITARVPGNLLSKPLSVSACNATKIESKYNVFSGNVTLTIVTEEKVCDTCEEELVEQPLMEFDGGVKDYLIVYEDRVVIRHSGVLNALSMGIKGDKTIYFSDITSVQYKKPGLGVGYIQFSLPGGREDKGGMFSASADENTITVASGNPALDYRAQEAVNLVNKKLKEAKAAKYGMPVVTQQVSSADELKKFKELLDCGVITQEEFDAKKKQLLGL